MASLLGLKTYKIYIYPLGGISLFDMPLNINPLKELLVIIMGPLFQFIAAFLLISIFDYNSVMFYHFGILYFNLLPIYPLDGGKLLNLLFNYFIPYKYSYKIIIYISYIISIIILFSNNVLSINMIITYIFLIFIIRKEHLKVNYIYNKFLLERYLNDYNYKKSIVIPNDNHFYRMKKNIIKNNNLLINEHDYLIKKYHKF